ncbi:alpha-soluble NSF attachment protein [Nematocida sp. LUAm3]|nr:alpha-soluble NSF attachment protein [Nematocida sp. LUAm3]KAI5176205.1 alpha-soluble NSF attachment protein [Nematocida sp. LUAm2]KAI5179193.1 alpha-soluble NSF attachment protein [Nematocida sp. LUAm1]
MSVRASPEELERKAEAYYKKSSGFLSKIFFKVDATQAADLYLQAAMAYSTVGEYKKSAEMFYRAGEILFADNKEESMYEASSAFVKSAEAYYIIDKEKSTDAYIRSFSIATNHMRDFSMAAILALKTAKSLKEIKKEEEAREYLYKAVSLYGQAKMCINSRNILVQCAEIEMRLKNYEKAFELYKDLAEDSSCLGQIIDKTMFFFYSIICGIILNKNNECSEILTKMEETRIETKISYQMLSIKVDRSTSPEELEKTISYYKRTHVVPVEVSSALQDVQMSIDPDNDIL